MKSRRTWRLTNTCAFSDRLFKKLLAVIVSLRDTWDNGEGSVHT